MTCPRCQHENLPTMKFCGECGTPLRQPEGSAQPAPSYENLQRSLSEALDQQTATAEILRVISSSPTDVQPVFDTIVRSAVRLCNGLLSMAFRYDGRQLSILAHHNVSSEAIEIIARSYPAAPSPESMAGRAVLRREVIHVSDVTIPGPNTGPRSQQLGLQLGYRAFLSVPMLSHGEPIGVINVARRDSRPFTEKQIALVQTFADQAVIAVENVRLFTELQTSNRELTTALDTQTATSDILRVISRSPTDVQPVFDAIVRSSVDLCHGVFSTAFRFDGERIHLAAQHNISPEGLAELHRIYPARPTREFITGRAILDRAVVHIPDIELDPENQYPTIARVIGGRSILIVPMLREGTPIGAITVTRVEPGPFSQDEIALLQTFADQAVIAIENVRLFKELEARNRDLTATSAI